MMKASFTLEMEVKVELIFAEKIKESKFEEKKQFLQLCRILNNR